jgi:hypothetical protein
MHMTSHNITSHDTTALKKRSQERSTEAMKNPLIAGVFTSNKDPVLVAERSKQSKKWGGGGGGGGGGSSSNSIRKLSSNSLQSAASLASKTSSHHSASSVNKEQQNNAMNNLLIPTEAYHHHHDPDEHHAHQNTLSDIAAANKRKGKKPYMVHKRERTLTEFMMDAETAAVVEKNNTSK